MSDKATYTIDLRDLFTPKLQKAIMGIKELETGISKIGGPTGSGGMLGVFGGSLARAFGAVALVAGITRFTKSIFNMGMELERTKFGFETLIGSAEESKKLFDELTQFANVTAYTNQEIYEGGETLLKYGADVKDVTAIVSTLGDVAMGNGPKLQSMIEAFGKLKQYGHLRGQQAIQFTTGGLNPLRELALMKAENILGPKASHKQVDSLADTFGDHFGKMMRAGAVSVAMVEEAFNHATGPMGRFYKMNEEGAKRFFGKWSTFTGVMEFQMATLGEAFDKSNSPILDWLIEFQTSLGRIDFGPFLVGVKSMRDVIGNFLSVVGQLGNVKAIQVFFNTLGILFYSAMVPFKFMEEKFKLIKVAVSQLGDSFHGLGEVIAGAFTLDKDRMIAGLNTIKESVIWAAKNVSAAAQKDAENEWQNLKNLFSFGTIAPRPNTALPGGPIKTGVKPWNPNGEDEGIGSGRMGGTKSITINVQKLLNVEKISADKAGMKDITDMVQKAILTALNDASLALG